MKCCFNAMVTIVYVIYSDSANHFLFLLNEKLPSVSDLCYTMFQYHRSLYIRCNEVNKGTIAIMYQRISSYILIMITSILNRRTYAPHQLIWRAPIETSLLQIASKTPQISNTVKRWSIRYGRVLNIKRLQYDEYKS